GLVIVTFGGRFGGGSTTLIVTLSVDVAPWLSVPVRVRGRVPFEANVTCSSQPLTGKPASPPPLEVHSSPSHGISSPGSFRSSALPRRFTLAPRNTSAPSVGAVMLISGASFTTLRTTVAWLLAPS